MKSLKKLTTKKRINEEESTYGTEKGIDNKLVFLYKSERNMRTFQVIKRGQAAACRLATAAVS